MKPIEVITMAKGGRCSEKGFCPFFKNNCFGNIPSKGKNHCYVITSNGDIVRNIDKKVVIVI